MMDMLDCGNCGADIVGSGPRPGYYSDGESIVCADCGATNSVTVAEEYDGDGVVHDIYVGSWSCVHGRADVEQCDECEIANGGAP